MSDTSTAADYDRGLIRSAFEQVSALSGLSWDDVHCIILANGGINDNAELQFIELIEHLAVLVGSSPVAQSDWLPDLACPATLHRSVRNSGWLPKSRGKMSFFSGSACAPVLAARPASNSARRRKWVGCFGCMWNINSSCSRTILWGHAQYGLLMPNPLTLSLACPELVEGSKPSGVLRQAQDERFKVNSIGARPQSAPQCRPAARSQHALRRPAGWQSAG